MAKTAELSGVPRHIAVIMDGNGRWAAARALPRPAGHRMGVKAVKQIVENCARRNVQVLTLFAFSSENWKRPKEEVSMLMSRFLQALDDEVADLHENGIRLTFVGNLQQLSPALRERMAAAVALTAGNGAMTLVIARTREELTSARSHASLPSGCPQDPEHRHPHSR